MGARWLPALGLTFEHVRCLRNIAAGQPLPASPEIVELVECGFVEVEQQDQLALTAAGRRYLRISSIDTGRGRGSARRRTSEHEEPQESFAESGAYLSTENATDR